MLRRRREDRPHRAPHRSAVHRHAHGEVRDAGRAARRGRKDRRYFGSIWDEDPHGRAALPVEREDALRQDLHGLPACQAARRQARARRDLQARGRGRLADRPGVPRRLRGLAIPLAASGGDPSQIDRDKPVVYFGSFQDLLGRDPAGNIKAKNEWLHTINWDLVVFDEYHFGAWRDTAKELFEGEDEAVADEETLIEYAPGLEQVNEDLDELSAKRRPTSCPSRPVPTSTCRDAVPGARDGRVHRGADLQLDLHRRAARQGSVRGGAPGRVEPVRRAAADAPVHLPDARRADRDRQHGRVRRVRPQRVLRGVRHEARPTFAHKATCRSGSTSCEAPTSQPRSTTSRPAPARRCHTRTSASCPTCSTRSGSCPTSPPATRWRTCSPSGTTRSGTATRWWSPRARRRASGWTRCPRSEGDRRAGSRPRRSRSRAASSPPA